MVERNAFADALAGSRVNHMVLRGLTRRSSGEYASCRQFREAEHLFICVEDLGVADAVDCCLSKGAGAFDALEILANGRLELNAPRAAF